MFIFILETMILQVNLKNEQTAIIYETKYSGKNFTQIFKPNHEYPSSRTKPINKQYLLYTASPPSS